MTIRCVDPFCKNTTEITSIVRSLDPIEAPDGKLSVAWATHVDSAVCHDALFTLTAEAFRMMMGNN